MRILCDQERMNIIIIAIIIILILNMLKMFDALFTYRHVAGHIYSLKEFDNLSRYTTKSLGLR